MKFLASRKKNKSFNKLKIKYFQIKKKNPIQLGELEER